MKAELSEDIFVGEIERPVLGHLMALQFKILQLSEVYETIKARVVG